MKHWGHPRLVGSQSQQNLRDPALEQCGSMGCSEVGRHPESDFWQTSLQKQWMLMFGCLVFGLFSEGYLYWIFQNGFLLQVVDLESVMNMSHVRRFSTSLFLGRFFEWTCSANVTQKLEVFASFPLLFVWYGNVPVDFASRQWFLDFWTEWQWYKSWHQSAFSWNHLSKLLKKTCLFRVYKG